MRSRLLFTSFLSGALLLVCALEISAQPGGGRGGRGGGRGGRGGGGDSSSRMSGFLDRIFNGKDTIRIADMDPRMRGFVERMAERAGIKGDTISKTQLTEAFTKMREQGGGFGGRGGSRGGGGSGGSGNTDAQAESFFKRSDRNGDGLLNFDEMSSTLKNEKEKWDSNKDGVISLAEYKPYVKAFIEKRAAERGGRDGDKKEGEEGAGGLPPGASVGGATEDILKELDKKPVVYRVGDDQNLPPGLPSWFLRYDTDKDSQVALYEWKEAGQALDGFAKYDRNDDAFLTIDEVMSLTTLAKGDKTKDDKNGSSGSSRGGSTRGGSSRGGSNGSSDWRSRIRGSGGGSPGGTGGASDWRSRFRNGGGAEAMQRLRERFRGARGGGGFPGGGGGGRGSRGGRNR